MTELRLPEQWGWCLDGCRHAFADALQRSCPAGTFRYLEIGLGHGETCAAVVNLLVQLKGKDWQAIGLDLERDPFKVRQTAGMVWRGHYRGELVGTLKPDVNGVYIVMCDLDRAMANQLNDCRFNTVFIDACHCQECSEHDFLCIEDKVEPAGCVIFHDASPLCQNANPQTFHERRLIGVRATLEKLGLLNNARPGWTKIHDLTAVTFGATIFQKDNL